MKKKILLSCLMVVLFVLVLAFSVSAADVNIDGVYYNIDTSKQTAFITATNKGSCKVADLVIPSTVTYNGVEYPVKIDKNAFDGNKNIKTVTIDGGVLDVGYRAFYNCTAITKVVLGEGLNPSTFNTQVFMGCKAITDFTIPSTMTSIRSTMLQNCTSLTSITIPSTVTKIESNVFSGCTGLQSIVIPDSVTAIDSSAFSGCKGLQSVTFSNSLTSIGSSAFASCSKLSSISLPSTLKSLGESAFNGCAGITEVSLPVSLTTLGNYSFRGCASLQTVYIPKGLTNYSQGAFSNCKALTNIVIDKDNTGLYFDSENKILYSYDKKTLHQCLVTTPHTDFEVSSNVTKITNHAFYACTSLVNVVIPDTVTSFGDNVFNGCSSLVSVKLPSKIAGAFPAYTFYGCKSLKNVTLPDGITSINNYAFYGCTALETVYYTMNKFTSVGSYAFSNCKSFTGFNGLSGIVFPEGFTTINSTCAFTECDSIKYVIFPSTISYLGQQAFSYCNNLQIVSFDKVSEKIATAIANGQSYTRVDFNNCGTFKGCTSLVAMCVPEGTTAIINRFLAENCTSLTAVYLPDSVTSFGTNGHAQGPFDNAVNMYFVSEPFTVSQCIVNDTVDLSKLNLPSKPSVYYMPSSLKEFTGHVETNGSSRSGTMFLNCHNLNETIVFGTSLTKFIANSAFHSMGTANSPKTVVFLADLTQYVTTQNAQYVSFIFANSADKSPSDIGITRIYKNNYNTGSYMYFCFDGSKYDYAIEAKKETNNSTDITNYIAKITEAKVIANNHLRSPELDQNIIDATCETPRYANVFCFCTLALYDGKSVETDGPLGHIMQSPVISYENNNFFVSGVSSSLCARDNCNHTDNVAVNPIFIAKGFAKTEADVLGVSFIQYFSVNTDALQAYISQGEYTVVSYGLIAVVTLADPENKDIIDENGAYSNTVNGTQKGDYVVFGDTNYKEMEIKVTNIGEANRTTLVYTNLCVVLKDKETEKIDAYYASMGEDGISVSQELTSANFYDNIKN